MELLPAPRTAGQLSAARITNCLQLSALRAHLVPPLFGCPLGSRSASAPVRVMLVTCAQQSQPTTAGDSHTDLRAPGTRAES